MTLLLDILHPAHVHFFRNAIAELLAGGHRVVVTSRDKDITERLLGLYGIPHRPISREASSKGGLLKELVSRNLKMAAVVHREKPDVLASIGGISTAQVGFLARRRNLIFYDTENATVSNLISYPFATEVVTPDCYRGWVPRRRHVPYPGYHELAYLHPSRFAPDSDVIRRAGINPEEPYSVVRFVSWKALHDVKARGFSLEDKLRLTSALERFGRVYITSESPLPGEFDRFRLPLPPHQVHHLLAFARLFIGESATMASEGAILGTPFVYLDVVGRGYTDEQENRYGLGWNYRPWQAGEAIGRAVEILEKGLKSDPDFRARRDRMLSEKVDVTRVIVERLVGSGGGEGARGRGGEKTPK